MISKDILECPEFISHQKVMQEKMAQIVKKIQENRYANEEVFLWNVIQKNPDINLLEYQICYAPTYGEYRDEFGTLTTTPGQRWWLEKL